MSLIKTALRYSDTPFGMSGRPAPPPGINFTDAPRKGQKNNPVKNMQVPIENKRALMKRNSRSLARAMQRAGGMTSPNGMQFNAVLQERGMNPTLMATPKTRGLAQSMPDDLYKQSMYNAFYDELEKVAFAEAFDESAQQGQAMPESAGTFNRALTTGALAAAGLAGYGGYRLGKGVKNMGSKVTNAISGKPTPVKKPGSPWVAGVALGGAGTYLAHDAWTGADRYKNPDVLTAGLNNTENKTY
jgi:hypothetical protein